MIEAAIEADAKNPKRILTVRGVTNSTENGSEGSAAYSISGYSLPGEAFTAESVLSKAWAE